MRLTAQLAFLAMAAGALLVMAGALHRQPGHERLAAPARRDPDDHIRPAGPEAMRHPPRRWDRVDETSDQSFPASDPPGTY